ncbi:MAG: UDP-diphospho-muramoylpentapeptide beta-N-acetylglucosaminyltransferase [Roseburia sp.]|nr:UDP-diphospho-muramoylpentapeptide beta-N-acetylglucosaminyltransferase [Roseburia sp.]MCM1098141.1 UDP-diphospho-muramoylpentapeptide beta-N-acetylglucosaminyltransferase [Ruminococcus flavefaciens]
MGHWAASQSLRQQLLQGFPDAKIAIEDFPAYALPGASGALYKGFQLLVTRGSGLFNMYYEFTSLGRTDARPPLEGIFLDKLAELLQQYRPDAVIATHPLCAQMVSRLKEQAARQERHGLDLPLITCITDISSHPEWINRNTDCYLAPSEEVKESLVRKGVERARICVTGIPVRQEFRRLRKDGRSSGGEHPAKESRSFDGGSMGEANRDSGGELPAKDSRSLDGGTMRENSRVACRELLIMGGGLGLLPSSEDFYDRLSGIPNTHVTIITGCNRRLYRHLVGRWENIEVIGYTDQVWEYMKKADMIVTKPGGITLFESIYAQTPIFTWPPALCQEKRNARWLQEKGIGWVAGRENCAEEIREILTDQQRLARAAALMGRLRGQLETERLNCLMAAIACSGGAAA